MIPLKLHIKNFLSYGAQQTVDFTRHNLICLSGKNGHGKSALLDALTWALWGQARKISGVAKADEGLLRLGQTTMMVTLDFACDSHRYRVRREYTIVAQKAQVLLDFGVFEPESDRIRPLTDKTIRATQAKIEATLGLDFDSFINSAFLRQGQSNEFSKKTPKDRKEILATILGLDRFESLRRVALDKAKDSVQLKEQGLHTMERLQHDLKHIVPTKEQLATLEGALGTVTTQEALLQTELKAIELKKQALTTQKNEIEKINFQRLHLEKTITEQIQKILENASAWRIRAREHRSQGNYSLLEKERAELQKELQNRQVLASERLLLKEQYLAKKELIRQFVHKVQEQYKQAHDTLKLSEQTIELTLKATHEKEQELSKRKTVYERELVALQTTINSLSTTIDKPYKKNLKEKEDQAERRNAYYHRFTTKAQALITHLATIEHKQKLIHTAEHAVCPLCDQRADKEDLFSKFSHQQKLYQHQLIRLSSCIKTLTIRLAEDNEQITQLKTRVADQQAALTKITELEKQKAQRTIDKKNIETEEESQRSVLQELSKKKERCIQELATLHEEFLKSREDEAYKKMNHELLLIEQAALKIVIDPSREKALHERLAILSSALEKQSIFLQEVARQDERKRFIAHTTPIVRALKKEKATLEKTTTELTISHQEEILLYAAESQKKRELEQLTAQKELLIHQKGALEAYYAQLIKLELEYKVVEKKAADETARALEYTAIAGALSKDGIQALLIEDALPEIEQEANNLLSRLTDNQAHLSIESVRDLKSGKSKETLDIKISDAVGVRPYELFSGGEAFRIDFALRIAISRLLTRRAGSALQTLIIDEGFGSQDEDGLKHIMEALHAISQDFSKIIIVSHLTSMKDEFPVHFTVTKTPEGSVVEVIQHC
ncbi:SMC family ATPase [Candidatus Dependentiae bacterium]|nr:SMC family ATPase [Candidatus Dependentiae bacterium]